MAGGWGVSHHFHLGWSFALWSPGGSPISKLHQATCFAVAGAWSRPSRPWNGSPCEARMWKLYADTLGFATLRQRQRSWHLETTAAFVQHLLLGIPRLSICAFGGVFACILQNLCQRNGWDPCHRGKHFRAFMPRAFLPSRHFSICAWASIRGRAIRAMARFEASACADVRAKGRCVLSSLWRDRTGNTCAARQRRRWWQSSCGAVWSVWVCFLCKVPGPLPWLRPLPPPRRASTTGSDATIGKFPRRSRKAQTQTRSWARIIDWRQRWGWFAFYRCCWLHHGRPRAQYVGRGLCSGSTRWSPWTHYWKHFMG